MVLPSSPKRPVRGGGKGNRPKRVTALFFRSASGSEPVRNALRELTKDERQEVARDVRTAD